MTSNRTPGDWKVHASGNGSLYVREVKPQDAQTAGLICSVFARKAAHPHKCKTARANAHVIAAAPKLLATSRNALTSLDWVLSAMPDIPAGSEFRASVAELRAAIAQAEGQS